jgi:hypothetical protein
MRCTLSRDVPEDNKAYDLTPRMRPQVTVDQAQLMRLALESADTTVQFGSAEGNPKIA